MFHIVLVEPEIPHNTGACGRLAVATGSRLHLVEPLGFSLSDRYVKRAGLDYWEHVDLRVWPSLWAFHEAHPEARCHFMTTKARFTIWEPRFGDSGGGLFQPGDFLVFGPETRGLARSYLEQQPVEHLRRLPMADGPIRSLNLSMAVAVTLYEAMRQAEQVSGGCFTNSQK